MTTPRVQNSTLSVTNSPSDKFIFVVCQPGAEVAFKNHYSGLYTPLRLAFSRPGLVTFKAVPGRWPVPPEKGESKSASAEQSNQHAPAVPQPGSAIEVHQSTQVEPNLFARLVGEGLGSVRGPIALELAQRALQIAGSEFQAIHIFQRDAHLPGHQGFEPGPNELTQKIGQIFGELLRPICKSPPIINGICKPNDRVLDIILVEADSWLIGQHRAQQVWETWPGGALPIQTPEKVISRAYRKMTEALAWSQLPIAIGDSIVEIGSAPGGSCQRLLDCGLRVTGVDPAEMDPRLLQHPKFQHWRSKAAGIKRKMFSRFKWLTADANVAPNYTLDVVEDIVNYSTSRFEGLLLTFKLSSLEMVDQINAAVDRIASWGFTEVAARQLASNRRECCVYAKRNATNSSR